MGTHGRTGFEHLVLGSVTEKVMRKATCALLTVPRNAPDATAAVPTLFHRILAAVDFSDVSLRALEYAVSLAEEEDGQLTVLHVTDAPRELARWAEHDEEGKRYVEQWKSYALERLTSLVSDDARVYCHVRERVETGDPSREILRVAAEQQSGLIVIGAHGTGVFERLFVGSTAQHVVRHAPCPVLTAGRRPTPASGHGDTEAQSHQDSSVSF
jgi:nucleotide-binding universal stress UspA family protein